MIKLQIICIAALLLTFVVAAIHIFWYKLPDFAVRINGIVMLISLATASFSTFKNIKDKD